MKVTNSTQRAAHSPRAFGPCGGGIVAGAITTGLCRAQARICRNALSCSRRPVMQNLHVPNPHEFTITAGTGM